MIDQSIDQTNVPFYRDWWIAELELKSENRIIASIINPLVGFQSGV
jgi:hypothetical protein